MMVVQWRGGLQTKNKWNGLKTDLPEGQFNSFWTTCEITRNSKLYCPCNSLALKKKVVNVFVVENSYCHPVVSKNCTVTAVV